MLAGFSPFSRSPRRPRQAGRRATRWAIGLAAAWLGGASPLPLLAASAPAPAPEAAGALEPIGRACEAALAAGDRERLRALQVQLLRRPPSPEPLAPLLARAQLLLDCRAPDGALRVLARISPAAGDDRRAWLMLRWQAAAAGLDHRLAADSLVRLAQGDLARLEALQLPAGLTGQARRSALDCLADHLEALGWSQRAADVLLSATGSAARLGRAVELAVDLPGPQRQALLERALEQAAAAGAWGLVAQLLDQQWSEAQRAGGGAPLSATDLAVVRRLRLSGRIDDAYGEWRLRRQLPQPQPRLELLERQLGSPRAPGGHASSPLHPALP